MKLTQAVKRYGSKLAVDGVDLEVRPGEFLVLLGPSGCGKTTTLRMIAGLEDIDSGFVAIDDRDMTKTPACRRDLGMVFQSYALFPHLTVQDNVAFGLALRGINRKTRRGKAVELLRLVGLDHYARRYPKQLSGGEQQRVGLARALAVSPKVLLMDEPFAALDRKLRQELQRDFRQLQRDLQITTIFVTHDQEEALQLADRVAVMKSGRIEGLDEPSRLYDHPKTPFVASFLGEANIFEGQVRKLDDGSLTLECDGLEIPLSSDSGSSTDGQLSVLVRPERVSLDTHGHPNWSVGFSGRITGRFFLGENVRYEVNACGRQMIVRSPSTAVAYHEGDEVRIGWRSDAVRVLES